MDYIKIKFGGKFDQFGSRIERTIEDIFRPRPVNPMFCSRERIWTPQMDIYETPERIIIRAEIAGVNKENLEVEISSKAVRIYGNRQELPRMEKATYRLAEIQYGKFERILYLPSPIDTEAVTSSYADGFLEINLVKLQQEETFRVPISDG